MILLLIFRKIRIWISLAFYLIINHQIYILTIWANIFFFIFFKYDLILFFNKFQSWWSSRMIATWFIKFSIAILIFIIWIYFFLAIILKFIIPYLEKIIFISTRHYFWISVASFRLQDLINVFDFNNLVFKKILNRNIIHIICIFCFLFLLLNIYFYLL